MILISYINNKHTYPAHILSGTRKIIIRLFKLAPSQLNKYVPPMPRGWIVRADRRNWPKKIPIGPYIEAIERSRRLNAAELDELMIKVRNHIERTKSLPDRSRLLRFCSNLINTAIDRSQIDVIERRIKTLYDQDNFTYNAK